VKTGITVDIKTAAARPAFTGTIAPFLMRTLTTGPVVGTVYEGFRVENVTVDATKLLRVSSIPGNKFVGNFPAGGGGVMTTRLKNVGSGSVWPVLRPGVNKFAVLAAQAGQAWEVSYFARFGGL
jgi:hypothetical protein